MKKMAIIGAGLAGLTLAEQLAEVAEITLFEKFHRVSGRMATRSYPPYGFDHGAQFFTAKHPAFKAFIQPLIEAGVVAHWHARFVEIDGTQVQKSRAWQEDYPHYVGVPNMALIGEYLSERLMYTQGYMRLNTQVAHMQKQAHLWHLSDEQQNPLGSYDWVVTTMPAEQALQLLPASFTHHAMLNGITMQPCYALMLGCEHSLNLSWDAAHVTNSILSWVSINSSKPGRSPHSGVSPHTDSPVPTSIVAMSRNQWAATHFNQPDTWVIHEMTQALAAIIGQGLVAPKLLQLKQWHFANAPKLASAKVLLDAPNQLAACGDWCISGRVESAYLSALQLAQAMRKAL